MDYLHVSLGVLMPATHRGSIRKDRNFLHSSVWTRHSKGQMLPSVCKDISVIEDPAKSKTTVCYNIESIQLFARLRYDRQCTVFEFCSYT